VTPLPSLPADAAGPSLRALHAAWRMAAAASASAPGQPVAYYELDWQGTRFPGERPWTARWRVLRHVTPYAKRRVLELGCNMALFSVFLLKDAHAAATLAVDRDPQILAAAALVAEALGVRPQFRRIDFDRDRDWEDQLEVFRPDVVVALSVLHWVQDKGRFLAFLGRFDEVVFEGHDSSRAERRRMLQAGFTEIELVDTSERGRPLLRARKR
jgi:SAM-dependent methyltransferase